MVTAIIILTGVLVLAWFLAPFWSRPTAAHRAPMPPATEARRQLRELEFDYATGKVDEEEYSQIKAAIEQKLTVSRSSSHPPSGMSEPRQSTPFDQQIQSSRATPEYSALHLATAVAEAEIAIARARLRLKKAASTCAQCGTALAGDARFCASCGAAQDTSSPAPPMTEPAKSEA